MVRSRLSHLVLIPIAFLLMGARAAPLVDPDPIAVPAGLSAQDVSKAIRGAIAERGWVVSKDEAGKIDAVLNLREHTARIAIAYDTKQVKPSYVASDNLAYSEKNGTRYIHRNYLKWMQNVVTDISRALQVASIQHEK
jgi:hypothetical protein